MSTITHTGSLSWVNLHWRRFVAAGWVALASAGASAEEFSGVVSQVVSGDTVVLKSDVNSRQAVKVRLAGVDAPEVCQAGGPAAQSALSRRLRQRVVGVESMGRDTDGVNLVRLRVDGEDIGAWMVREGLAWSVDVRDDYGSYYRLEQQAQAAARGVHAAVDAVRPDEFRRVHGPCESTQAWTAPQPSVARPSLRSLSGDPVVGARASTSTSLFNELVNGSPRATTTPSTSRARSNPYLSQEPAEPAGSSTYTQVPGGWAVEHDRVRSRQRALEQGQLPVQSGSVAGTPSTGLTATPRSRSTWASVDPNASLDAPLEQAASAPANRRRSPRVESDDDPLSRFAR